MGAKVTKDGSVVARAGQHGGVANHLQMVILLASVIRTEAKVPQNDLHARSQGFARGFQPVLSTQYVVQMTEANLS